LSLNRPKLSLIAVIACVLVANARRRSDNRDDGSVLVDFANVKDVQRSSPPNCHFTAQFDTVVGSRTGQRQRGLTCGYEDYLNAYDSYPVFIDTPVCRSLGPRTTNSRCNSFPGHALLAEP
jgi:hypothetical protein